MFRSCYTAFVIPLLCASTVFSGPKIQFDVKSFKCGTVIEGKTDKLNAVFKVKNTGNAVLKFESVRPGCGCTVVKYDTTVLPGKTSRIEAQVNIKGYGASEISKYITVTSNAENEPSVRLTIDATIQAVIDVSDGYLNLGDTDRKSPKSIYLSTKKTDLQVSDVSFRANENGETSPWQANLVLPLKHAFVPTDSIRANGYHVYKLDIYCPLVDKTESGVFTIKTNHPDKAEISVPGMINR